MKKNFIVSLVTGLLLFCLSGFVQANMIFNTDVTPGVIFGSGNDNGAFTIDQNNGVEVGLRGKLRFPKENTFNYSDFGIYTFNTGGPSTGVAEWSIEWSINTNWNDSTSWKLDDLTYLFGRDIDASQATNFVTGDPINLSYADHSIGDNLDTKDTDYVAADSSEYSALIGAYNVAQNSWQAHWIFPSINPDIDGTYDVFLAAFDGQRELARTEIQIIVGDGGAPIPEPATMLLFGFGLLGVAGVSRRKK